MTERTYLKPAVAGAIVRDPVTYAPLAQDGERKELNSYWRRRIKEGSVLITSPVMAKPKTKGKHGTPAAQVKPENETISPKRGDE